MVIRSFLPYHVVENRYWPFCCSFGVFSMLVHSVFWWHLGFTNFLIGSFVAVVVVRFLWWKDVSNESFFGYHRSFSMSGLRRRMVLFILSEVAFFVRFFWRFFHKCWGYSIDLGCRWPPTEFKYIIIDPFSVPLLNTLILLSSGVTVTWAHHSFLGQQKLRCNVRLLLTVSLGGYFLFLQFCEYCYSDIWINSFAYGSIFFMLTGFHGMHVTIGAIFLLVCFLRKAYKDFNRESHVGFECAAWYWHFVDVVWIFLFFWVYWYSSL